MSERGEIKRDGARAQKNSGRGDYQKGDAIQEPFLFDYKEAISSFTMNKNIWAKICTDTFRVSRDLHPCLRVVLGETQKVRLSIIESSMLDELIRVYNEHTA